MKYDIKPLRSVSLYDYFLVAVKFAAWVASILLLLYIFFALFFSALKSPAAFAYTVLIFALSTIAFVFALIVLNVLQKIIFDRVERNQQKQLAAALSVIDKYNLNPSDKDTRDSFRVFLNHLNTLEIAAGQKLPEDENQDLSRLLIDIGAADVLEKQALRSRRKWRRIEALTLLGWLRPQQSLPLLNRALYDPDVDIITAAVDSLAKYVDDSAYQLLLEALDEGRLPRSRLASFIESSNCKNKLPILTRYAQASNPKVRFWIAYLLGRVDSPDSLTVLASMSKDPDANVRAGATEALGRLGDKQAVALVKERLLDKDWPVRLHAAKAVSELRAEILIPDLIDLLRDDQWWVRENSAQALERFGQAARPYLIDLLGTNDRFARNKAAEILGRLGVIKEWIGELSASPIKAKAARGYLIAVGRAEAINIIEEASIKAQPDLAVKLIDILGEIGYPGAKTTLETLAEGKFDKRVKKEAEKTLAAIKGAA